MIGSSCSPCCAGCTTFPIPISVEIDVTTSALEDVGYKFRVMECPRDNGIGQWINNADAIFSKSGTGGTLKTGTYSLSLLYDTASEARFAYLDPFASIEFGVGKPITASNSYTLYNLFLPVYSGRTRSQTCGSVRIGSGQCESRSNIGQAGGCTSEADTPAPEILKTAAFVPATDANTSARILFTKQCRIDTRVTTITVLNVSVQTNFEPYYVVVGGQVLEILGQEVPGIVPVKAKGLGVFGNNHFAPPAESIFNNSCACAPQLFDPIPRTTQLKEYATFGPQFSYPLDITVNGIRLIYANEIIELEL